MSDRRHNTFRRHRQLPSIPARRRHGHFQPTVRCAIDWIQKHKDVIDTFVSMMETYPKLLQHRSCDRMWNFITKIAYYQQQEKFKVSKYSHVEVPVESSIDEKIPEISITHAPSEMPLAEKHEDFPVAGLTYKDIPDTVFVCGNAADEKWHKLIVGLSEQYAIRSTRSVDVESNDTKRIRLSDVVVFLFDNKSIGEKRHIDQLNAALKDDKPVIYVRDLGFSLPEPLPAAVYSTPPSYNTPPSSQTETRLGAQRNANLADKNLPNDSSSQSSGQSQQVKDNLFSHTLNKDYIRSDSTLSNISVKSCPPSSTAKNNLSEPPSARTPTPTSGTSNKARNYLHLSPALPVQENAFTFEEQPKKRLSVEEALTVGFRKSVLYDKNCHNRSIDNMCAAINKYTGFSRSGARERTVLQNEFLSAQASDNTYSVLEGDHVTQGRSYAADFGWPGKRVSEPDISDTVYLIYESDNGPESQPKVVHYPQECVSQDMSNSPSIESFGFQDVDLSKHINELDLFSEEED